MHLRMRYFQDALTAYIRQKLAAGLIYSWKAGKNHEVTEETGKDIYTLLYIK